VGTAVDGTLLERGSRRRVFLSPVIVAAWLWVGLIVLLLLYSSGLSAVAPAQHPARLEELRELWLGPTPVGLPVRHLIKVIDVLLVVLLWLQWTTLRSRRERRRWLHGLLYLGTACLLLALEWGCHLFGESLQR
jgi:hypothetical protein